MHVLKQTEQELQKLVKDLRSGKRSLFDIATRCVALLQARADYAALLHIDEADVAEHLTATYLTDFAIDALGFEALLAHFPERKQWDRPLLDLLAEARRTAKSNDEQATRTRRAVKVAEHEQVLSERDDLRSQVTNLQAQLDQLETENRDLRHLNCELKGRLDELERVLDKVYQ